MSALLNTYFHKGSTVKTPIRNITWSAAKVFRIGGLFRIGGSIFWSKNIMNLNRYKT